ncbi:hypothetical protein KEM52_001215 [Ascosphaera acerosa]|nr:hypothetical protein KEM52_001215 [Ascosphaera acerosa]
MKSPAPGINSLGDGSATPEPTRHSADSRASTECCVQPESHDSRLWRGLESRHLQFYALSGAIGTGLFVGIGQVLSSTSPVCAFFVYMITAANIFAVTSCLGEMATWLPVSGGLPVFGARFVNPSLGFAIGWNYYYVVAVAVPMQVGAGAHILQYWAADAPTSVLVTVLLLPIVVINMLPVAVYGEVEFVTGAFKILTSASLVILVLIVDLEGAHGRQAISFRYWAASGPLNPYLVPGVIGRFLALWKLFVQASVSYSGSDTVIAAAGEAKQPTRALPRAVRHTFWRIALLYVLSVFFIGLCASSNDERLHSAIRGDSTGVAQSPFVIAITHGRVTGLPHLINALLLCIVWSSGNASFYLATRILYATALERNGPFLLTRTTSRGVPIACVAITAAIALLSYLNVGVLTSDLLFWLNNVCAVSGIVLFAVVNIIYLRFYRALEFNRVPRSSLYLKAPFQPLLAKCSLTFCVAVLLFNGFDCILTGPMVLKTVAPAYFGMAMFGALYLAHRLACRTSIAPVEQIDIWRGRASSTAAFLAGSPMEIPSHSNGV